MVLKRQDAWTPEDDMILAEVTLRQIREGGTQLAAFEEVAQKLGRTPAACGFRWNSTVRKNFEDAIKIAKSQRQKRYHEKKTRPLRISQADFDDDQENTVFTIEGIIRFLRQYKNEVKELQKKQKHLEEELREKTSYVMLLERENLEMKGQLNHVQSDYQLVNDDYRTLVQIMERARKMAILDERDSLSDEGGSLEVNNDLEKVDK
ncbi:RsfA family transcriptional regulator [Hazenella sp. IB182357]|uniref:RsfA family transcriptional regulator n=1 Tax=Polycladospora coralii TaxID=2771432 RepID=A0A926N799_9BACL|nr:RsfA family transcriptional regulator [Polycladospora coralii]MBD1371301.1 RsfA family transcriptional regulator [Polycladospora coralii]